MPDLVRGLAAPALALLAGAAAADPVPYPPAAGPVAGGWHEMSTHAPELRTVARFALAEIPRRAPLTSIFRAERQVVAGLNYRLVLALADGSKWRVVVWQKPGGAMKVTSVEPVR